MPMPRNKSATGMLARPATRLANTLSPMRRPNSASAIAVVSGSFTRSLPVVASSV